MPLIRTLGPAHELVGPTDRILAVHCADDRRCIFAWTRSGRRNHFDFARIDEATDLAFARLAPDTGQRQTRRKTTDKAGRETYPTHLFRRPNEARCETLLVATAVTLSVGTMFDHEDMAM